MERIILKSNSPEQTVELGVFIGTSVKTGDVILFTGDLGSGKTTMIGGIARGAGFRGQVTSPTFTLVHEYRGRLPIYHIDAYRLDSYEEAVELGLDEMYEGQGLTLVEWSENLHGVLPRDCITIDVQNMPGSQRLLTLSYRGPAGSRLYEALRYVLKGTDYENTGN